MPTEASPAPATLRLRLPFRRPLWPDNLFGQLAATAVPGVEQWPRRPVTPHPAALAQLDPASLALWATADHAVNRLPAG